MKQYVNVSVQEKLACLSLKWIIVSLNHCDIYIPMDIFKRIAALFSRVYIMMILEIIIFLNLFILRMKSSMCVKVLHNLEWTKENCILQTLVERKWAQKSEDQHSSCITHQWNCWGLGAHNQHSSGYQTFQDSCANLHSPPSAVETSSTTPSFSPAHWLRGGLQHSWSRHGHCLSGEGQG